MLEIDGPRCDLDDHCASLLGAKPPLRLQVVSSVNRLAPFVVILRRRLGKAVVVSTRLAWNRLPMVGLVMSSRERCIVWDPSLHSVLFW